MGASTGSRSVRKRVGKWLSLLADGDLDGLVADVRTGGDAGQEKPGRTDDGDAISDAATIANLLAQATDEKVPVEVGFGNKIVVFQSHFVPEIPPGDDDPVPSSAYLRDRHHVLLGELNPADGNERVVNAEFLTLHFPVKNKYTEFQTRFMGMADRTDVKAFRLAFPTVLFRKPQRRGAVRAQIGEEHGVTVTVTRAAGLDFEAAPADVSMGGVGFFIPREVAAFTPPTEAEIHFRWPEGQRLSVPGTIVRVGNRKGRLYGQIRFTLRSYELNRKLGELVAYVQRKQLSGRVRR